MTEKSCEFEETSFAACIVTVPSRTNRVFEGQDAHGTGLVDRIDHGRERGLAVDDHRLKKRCDLKDRKPLT